MSDDIVTRLRRHSHTEYPMGDGQVFRLKMPLLTEAADEIERLQKLTNELAQIMMPFSLLMTSEEQQKVIKAVRGE